MRKKWWRTWTLLLTGVLLCGCGAQKDEAAASDVHIEESTQDSKTEKTKKVQ